MSDKLPPTEDKRCGTSAGYQAHRYRGEVPCDSCCRAHAAHDRAYNEANREAIADRKRAYNEANREAIADRKRAYYEANREAIAEKNRAWREANRESRADYNRAYYEANREANREASAVQHRAYYDANREEVLRRNSARRASVSQSFASVAVHSTQAWTAEDDAITRATYDQPIVMVAAQLRRTPGAVNDRRVDLRKLDRNQRKATA